LTITVKTMHEDSPRAAELGNTVRHADHRPMHTWFLLHPHDQGTVAWLLVGTLFLIASVWFARGGAHGELIEWDPAIRSGLTFQLDVNRADWVEFALMPGIGEKLAQRIVTYRSERGPFGAKADLLQVPGIGPKKLAAIEPYLLIRDVSGEASRSLTEREQTFE
jgi:competence ComEA-like helix-hairpin-helix protein